MFTKFKPKYWLIQMHSVNSIAINARMFPEAMAKRDQLQNDPLRGWWKKKPHKQINQPSSAFEQEEFDF